MTQAVANLKPIIEATFSQEDYKALISYAQEQLRDIKPMTEKELFFEHYTPLVIKTFNGWAEKFQKEQKLKKATQP
ncbi:hypothetical protein ACQ1R0_03910 [Ornithobacterium rhinotracheale]|uniref:hypothetical protein n=1 Tax=Ornithobacterium rhinotracheale TaxID=28251 RepID=UPI00403700FC